MKLKNKLHNIALTTLTLLMLSAATVMTAQTPADWKKLKGNVTMYLANDLGRNGYYDQKPIAELMGHMGETLKPKCVIAAGDVHHFNGIQSVNDPLWMTNYELIYSHPELMINWFPVCGNHEYRGNTQAVIDYSKVSRRWMMPSRYYYKVVSSKGTTVRVVFVDTTPLIQRYRNNPEVYPDARMQNMEAQLQWLDATLRDAKEDWIIVVGHHPIYAQTEKNTVEQEDLRRCLLPVLQRYHPLPSRSVGELGIGTSRIGSTMTTDDKLRNHTRDAQQEYASDVNQDKGCATFLTSHIREAPYVTQTYGATCSSKYHSYLATKTSSI